MLPHLLSPLGARCAACGVTHDVMAGLPLCPDCARRLIRAAHEGAALCPRCLSALLPGQACPVCRRDPDRLISRTYAPYRYRQTVRSLILNLKFAGNTQAAALLAPWMARAVREAGDAVLMPVPLGTKRLRERGYNQAQVLAMLVGRLTGLPVREGLARVRETKRQSSLGSVRERQRNLRDAFALRQDFICPDKPIVLVDDVRTSGATALACARALREQGGAADVRLLCAAIAPGAGKTVRPARRKRRIFHRKGS